MDFPTYRSAKIRNGRPVRIEPAFVLPVRAAIGLMNERNSFLKPFLITKTMPIIKPVAAYTSSTDSNLFSLPKRRRRLVIHMGDDCSAWFHTVIRVT